MPGSHICRGFRGDAEPKVRSYPSFACSTCGGKGAVELPGDEDMEYGYREGQVSDRRRFADLLAICPQCTMGADGLRKGCTCLCGGTYL